MPLPWEIVVFFVAHWVLAVFFQTFFLHRYGAHRMFTMSKGWERFFHLCTFITQGSSFLNPRAYAILHRMHHAYSDTEKDPHSPVIFKNPIRMMDHTKDIYRSICAGVYPVEERFDGGAPSWPLIERASSRWLSSIFFGTLYVGFYFAFATEWWHFSLLFFHFFMGPTHGAIVNWFGHWLGYRNFDSKDASKNTLRIDFVTVGELFQNNHHKYGMRPKFAVRWFEIDPAWWGIKAFALLGIIKLRDERLIKSEEEADRHFVEQDLAIDKPALSDAE